MEKAVDVIPDSAALRRTDSALEKSIAQAAEYIAQQTVQDQVMPFDVGTMQTSQHCAASAESGTDVIVNTPYARKMYYGDGYNFQKANNANAQARWYSQWDGDEGQERVASVIARFVKYNSGGAVE